MLTSFRSDPARVKKEMQMSTFSAQYHLNVPGPGDRMPYFEDVHTRLTKWGANYDPMVALDVDNELRGNTRKLTKDGTQYQIDRSIRPRPSSTMYRSKEPTTLESRASHPAWELRDQDGGYGRWERPWLNPQDRSHWERDFQTQICSKMEARDAGPSSNTTISWQDAARSALGNLV